MAVPRSGTASKAAHPIRGLWQRFAYAVLVMGAFALMVVGKADLLLVERLRVAIADATAPILAILSHPAAAVSDTLHTVRDLAQLREENERLREENARLLQWRHVAGRLEAENRSLRELTQLAAPPTVRFISSRIIADGGGAFVRSVLIGAGTADGVRKGQAAMTGSGLVGRIAEVGRHHARILLITDLNSRIPVLIEATRDPAILAGDNSAKPRILHLPQNAQLAPGDRIVTSGHGGVFPPGLPVGIVASVAEGVVRVQPYVDWARLEYVRVLDYATPGLIDTDGRIARRSAGARDSVSAAP